MVIVGLVLVDFALFFLAKININAFCEVNRAALSLNRSEFRPKTVANECFFAFLLA